MEKPQTMYTCFPPLVRDNTRVLVLGSFPGKQSLIKQEYYGNTRNHFWELVFSFLGYPVPDTYQKKITLLLDSGLGLWDAIHACSREGSSDSAITNAKLNNICALLETHQGIKTVLCNGSTSFRYACQACRHRQRKNADVVIADCNALPEKQHDNSFLLTIEKFMCLEYNVTFLRLPSTSPIPTRVFKTLDVKIPYWHGALRIAKL